MLTRLLLGLITVLMTAVSISACTCITVSDPNAPPCGKIGPAEVIFVGTVLDIENPPYEVSKENPEALQSRYRFRIDERIAGLEGQQEIDIYSGSGGGGDCTYQFKRGEQYVVFPSRNGLGQLIATICSATSPVALAQAILPPLRAARDKGTVGSVYGVLQVGQQPFLSVTDDVAPRPLQYANMSLRSDTRVFAVRTDSNGAFAIYSVPPGTYHVTAELPPNMEFARPILNGPPDPLILAAGDCSEYNSTALPTARIRGRVLGAHGKPLKFAEAELFRPEKYQPTPLLMTWQEVQDQKGFFEFDHVGPGDYLLVYKDEDPQTGELISLCFYPGVPDVGRAEHVHIEGGQQVLAADIHLRDRCLRRR